jgi:hypothetical protein
MIDLLKNQQRIRLENDEKLFKKLNEKDEYLTKNL